MESLEDTDWDVLISGTGIQESLLALALSKSNKKVLHVDQNGYYGGAEAALSLQEAEEWAKATSTAHRTILSNAAIYTDDPGSDVSLGSKLGFSRAYSLALAPHIIYTRSSLLPLLVSSRSDQQLEFLAVGSWFVYTAGQNGNSASLARVPGSREDLFADQSIEPRAKRSLMKFLRFIGDFENQSDWQDQAGMPFHSFLSSRFNLPANVQAPFAALTLSPHPSSATTVAFALPRVARHLRSMGLFGPGFGAVVPKWGGLAEIAQVGCRAGAVGGAVYVLGTGLAAETPAERKDASPALAPKQLNLTNGDKVKTRWLAGSVAALPQPATSAISSSTLGVSRCIAIIASPLKFLFPAMAEGAPQPAVAVVVFPSSSNHPAAEGKLDSPPIHLFIHSSETGECPPGQTVIYASTAIPGSVGTSALDHAIGSLLSIVEEAQTPRVLWRMRYEHVCSAKPEVRIQDRTVSFPLPSADLAFDDEVIEQVRLAWAKIVDGEERDGFMRFAAREEEVDVDVETI